jgi:benzoylformate decarboxylase
VVSGVPRRASRRTADVATADDLEQEFKTALSAGTTTVIVVRTQPQQAML